MGGKWADLAANRVSQRQTVKSCVWRLCRSAARTVKQCQPTAGAQGTTGVSQRSQVQILPPLQRGSSLNYLFLFPETPGRSPIRSGVSPFRGS